MSFSNHLIEHQERFVAYELQNCKDSKIYTFLSGDNLFAFLLVVADIGGLIGLFLGFSILSAFEFCYFVIDSLKRKRQAEQIDAEIGEKKTAFE